MWVVGIFGVVGWVRLHDVKRIQCLTRRIFLNGFDYLYCTIDYLSHIEPNPNVIRPNHPPFQLLAAVLVHSVCDSTTLLDRHPDHVSHISHISRSSTLRSITSQLHPYYRTSTSPNPLSPEPLLPPSYRRPVQSRIDTLHHWSLRNRRPDHSPMPECVVDHRLVCDCQQLHQGWSVVDVVDDSRMGNVPNTG